MWKLDCLGRNIKGQVVIMCDLDQRGSHFKSLIGQIASSKTVGRCFFYVMASLLAGPYRWRKHKMDDSKVKVAK